MGSQVDTFMRVAKNPLKFRLFLLSKLPTAFFSGVRIKQVDENSCTMTIRYSWFSQNPFRSTYFACLSMAAEMSTGALAIAHTYKREPSISMLITRIEGSYYKRAVGTTFFQCTDGKLILNAIEKAIASGESQTITAKSIGTNEAGESIAEFLITWSFKMRTKK